MARQKIDYGIDLGTTNSAIASLANGEIKIIKSKDGQMDTTPSVVYINKAKTIFVGLKAFNQIDAEARKTFKEFQNNGIQIGANTFSEFKRTMGTDKKYKSTNIAKELSSEDLSAEVLKKLKSYVTDDEIHSVIITVPAKFRQNQLNATQKASELAGFDYCELLQEPIAASIAYGLDSKNMKGYWLVFDFGGGTFDAALMKVDDGIMKVVDTEGDNNLGGKNIDYAIVDHLLIPHLAQEFRLDLILEDEFGKNLLRDALKKYAEEAKVELSINKSTPVYADDLGEDADGNELILDLKINLEQYEEVVSPIFQRAIDITLKLLARNRIERSMLETLLLVGGPTFSQTLRRKLKEQICTGIETSIDPMTAVAKGAALFAGTRDIPVNQIKRDTNRVQLTLRYPETTVETEENIGLMINRKSSSLALEGKLYAEITRNDNAWSSGKMEIVDDAEIFSLILNSGRSNCFTITLFDNKGNILQCEPDEFTIIQGLKVANATLPYNIGIDLFEPSIGKIGVYTLKGLEKNTSLPAKGKGIFKTQKDIRPGNGNDQLKIEIYECGYKEDGSKKILNELVNLIIISGEDLPQFLPANSEVEIVLEIDSSRRIKFSAYFPYLDETVELNVPEQRQTEFSADTLNIEIFQAKKLLTDLENDAIIIDYNDLAKMTQELDEIEILLENGRGDYNTKTQVMERLREVLKEIDQIKEANEWPTIEGELNWLLERMKNNWQRYGSDKNKKQAEQLENQTKLIIKQKNIKLAKELMEEIRSFNFALVRDDIGFWINYIKNFDANFSSHKWSNSMRARTLIDEAKQIISSNPSKMKIEEIVRELFSLLPEPEKAAISENDDSTLMR
jgi:molecular chaperone DnaK